MMYLAGIDSGGTHTNIRIRTPDGTTRMLPEIDESLTSNRSNQEIAATFAEILVAVRANTSDDTTLWINAAGYSAPTRDRFEQLLRTAATAFKGRIGMCNDAIALLMAHEPDTVIVIAGTGSVAMGRSASGAVVTRGGDEWVVADYGSAFWIGLNGIRAAYDAIEGGPDTSLRTCLIEHYRPLGSYEAPDSEHAAVSDIARRLASLGTATKPRIASFARQVTHQAELGDEAAQQIVRSGVDELAGAAARVYRALATQAQPRAVRPRFRLSGSVAYNSRFYFEAFEAALGQFLFDVRESSGGTVDVTPQLNGLSEALSLASHLAGDELLPVLDPNHPYSIVG